MVCLRIRARSRSGRYKRQTVHSRDTAGRNPEKHLNTPDIHNSLGAPRASLRQIGYRGSCFSGNPAALSALGGQSRAVCILPSAPARIAQTFIPAPAGSQAFAAPGAGLECGSGRLSHWPFYYYYRFPIVLLYPVLTASYFLISSFSRKSISENPLLASGTIKIKNSSPYL